MKKVIQILALAGAMTLAGGCWSLTFEGPGGWDLNQDAEDAQFDFNHSMVPAPK